MKVMRLVFFMLSLCVFSCSNFFSGGRSGHVSDISGSITFKEVRSLGYMGGSVYYNPADVSSSQLLPNATIAVRLGKAIKYTIDAQQETYTDLADSALYGYLTVESIDSDNIRFDYTLFDKDGGLVVDSTESLALGCSCDLDGDGSDDLCYRKPIIIHAGLESAIYREFVSSQENLTTSMFSIIASQYAKGLYPDNVIGINPDDKLIVIKYNTDGTTKALSYRLTIGDYVLDNRSGEYQVYTTVSSSRELSESSLETVDSFSNIDYLFTLDSFVNSTALSFYTILPSYIKSLYAVPQTDSEVVSVLNQILAKADLIPIYSQYEDVLIPSDALSELIAALPSYSSSEIAQINRLFLEHKYPNECPLVCDKSVTATDIIPLASITIGDATVPDSTVSAESKAMTAIGYNAERDAILLRYSGFKTLFDVGELKSGSTKVNINNGQLKIGVKGTFSITWSSVSSSLEGAALVYLDTDISVSGSYTTNLLDVHQSFSYPVFTYGPIALSIGGTMYGTIPLTVSFSGSQSFSNRASFIGLYGAGISASAEYGVNYKKWWFVKIPVPYFRTNGDAYLIKLSSYYIGCDNTPSTKLSASVSVSPSIGCGFTTDISKIVTGSITTGASITPSLKVSYDDSHIVGTAAVDLGANVTAGVHVGVTIPIVRKDVGKSWSWTLAKSTENLGTWELFRKAF
jgi:hypothetical protein